MVLPAAHGGARGRRSAACAAWAAVAAGAVPRGCAAALHPALASGAAADWTALIQVGLSTEPEAWPSTARRREAAAAAATSAPAKRGVVGNNRQLMINQGDVEYVSHMTVGKQTVVGIMDTGSFELVVFSTECQSCGTAAKYSPKASSSHSTGSLMTVQSYGSGDTYSWEAADEVQIGPFPKKKQTFWEVVDARMPILKSANFEAIIGLGPPETPAADSWAEVQTALTGINKYYAEARHPPADVAQTVKDAIDAAVEMSASPTMLDNFEIKTFSLCMGSKPGADGYIIWEDASAFAYPERFTTIEVMGKHTWSVALSNVRLTKPGTFTDNKIDCFDGKQCTALVDSGTSLLAVPKGVVEKIQDIVANMGADCDLSRLPSLMFELGGNMLSLPPDAYVAQTSGSVSSEMTSLVRIRDVSGGGNRQTGETCKVLLMESYMDSKQGPLWIFGMPFFRKYYTSFHVGTGSTKRALHVAEANDDCEPGAAGASLARSRSTQARRIDVSRLHAPPLLRGSRYTSNVSVRVRVQP